MKPFLIAAFTLCALSAASANIPNDQWHQWRGPLANGVAPDADPPVQWSESENIVWKKEIPGFGTSTPIIWENNVIILTAVKIESDQPAAETPSENRGGRRGFGRGPSPSDPHQFVVLNYDRNDGSLKWKKVCKQEVPHEGHHQDHGFASGSPVTDGEHIFVFFGSRGLYCLDFDGEIVWEKDLGNMETRMGFGEGTSPALSGGVLVVNWDHEGDSFIVAMNKKDGSEIWRKSRDERTSWNTPLIVEHDGRKIVIANGTNRTRAYDLSDGELLWECGGQTDNPIPSVVTGHGLAYAMSGFRGNALKAIPLDAKGDVGDEVAWSHNKSTPYVPSPLLYGDKLYFISGNNAMLSCFDAATGKPHYESERFQQMHGVYASPVGASDRVYLTGRNGTSVVIKNAPAIEILSVNKLDDKFDSTPALVGDRLFLRGHKNLYCIGK